MTEQPKIFPLGDNALTVDFGNEISIPLNDRALALASHLDSNRFPGFIESAPAYSSVGIFYDMVVVRDHFPQFASAFDAVRSIVESALKVSSRSLRNESRQIEIPTNFDDGAALDLMDIARFSGLSPVEVIDVFLSKTYRVFMIGFLPGFGYMGEVEERIAMPRKSSPRMLVPKGSVGIAGRQTGIYPFASPGGWQIIGRTDVEMFTPHTDEPCRLRPGDEVKFVRAG